MILNLLSSRVQRDSLYMYSTQQQTSLKYQRPVQDANKVTGKHSFHWFGCAGRLFLGGDQDSTWTISDVIFIIFILRRSCLVGCTG